MVVVLGEYGILTSQVFSNVKEISWVDGNAWGSDGRSSSPNFVVSNIKSKIAFTTPYTGDTTLTFDSTRTAETQNCAMDVPAGEQTLYYWCGREQEKSTFAVCVCVGVCGRVCVCVCVHLRRGVRVFAGIAPTFLGGTESQMCILPTASLQA